jgi:hypothetical protein
MWHTNFLDTDFVQSNNEGFNLEPVHAVCLSVPAALTADTISILCEGGMPCLNGCCLPVVAGFVKKRGHNGRGLIQILTTPAGGGATHLLNRAAAFLGCYVVLCSVVTHMLYVGAYDLFACFKPCVHTKLALHNACSPYYIRI